MMAGGSCLVSGAHGVGEPTEPTKLRGATTKIAAEAVRRRASRHHLPRGQGMSARSSQSILRPCAPRWQNFSGRRKRGRTHICINARRRDATWDKCNSVQKFVDCSVQTSKERAVSRSLMLRRLPAPRLPRRSEGQAACRRAQRKPNMPTQVNDSPRAFPKGHMGLKQKMATTQQALGGVAAPSLIAPHTVQTSYGAPPSLLSAGLRDGRGTKVRPAQTA